MRKNKYILILLSCCIAMTMTGCQKTKSIDYKIDDQLSSIPSGNYYPQDILDKDLQSKLIAEQSNNENIIIDHTLINYKDATNKMPMEDMLLYPKSYFEDKTLDWFGIEWNVTAYENEKKDMVSSIKLKVVYDINDLDFATRKSKEISDKFLKTFGNIVYSDNIYENNFANLEDSVIRVIADVKDEDLYAVLNIGIFNNTFDNIKTPYLEILFVHKNNLHDIDDYELNEIIEYMSSCLKSVNITPPFKTIKLDPYNGYIMNDPKSDEDKTPEEKLNEDTIFYTE